MPRLRATAAHPPMSRRLANRASRLLPRSIATRFVWAGALTLGSVIVLAFGALFYIERTNRVVADIRDRDVALSSTATDIELLLERHRKLVESAIAQTDLVAANNDMRVADDIATTISTLMRRARDPSLDQARALHSEFVSEGHRALFFAAAASPREAREAVNAYFRVANPIQAAVRSSRELSIATTERRISDLVKRGKRLRTWVTAAAIIALLIVLPICVVIISGVAFRLKSIAGGMRRVALNDLRDAAAIANVRAETSARDEIGEMARALEIFKRNAATLLSNTHEIEKLNTWFHIALNNMARGLSMFDAQGKLLVCNDRYLELYCLPQKLGVPGTSFEAIAEHWCSKFGATNHVTPQQLESWMIKLHAQIATGAPFSEVHEIEAGRTALVNTQPLEGGGWVDLHEDITEKLAAETEISRLAHFDTLTGLANRHYFQETLEEALLGLGNGMRFAVLWFDLDKFKAVNDTLGHPSGDALLKIVAARLRDTVRKSDFIARLGGDEFAIIATGANFEDQDAATLARRLLRIVSAPYDLDGRIVSVGVSIGIVIAPEHGVTAHELTRNADRALYRAKSRGRGNAVLFNDNLEAEISGREQAEADLRRALASNQLLLHYQPIIDVTTGRIKSCEALMRWHHPVRGMVSPGEFIPLAEEMGLIGAMGEWALRQACRDAAEWPDGIMVSVNVAATQFTSTDMVLAVKSALQVAGLAASRLELEVTETIMLKDNAATIDALRALRDAGVSIALDDFGTGYASLSYLRAFPFNKIKIDQCFVKDIATRPDCFSIVQAIVSLAHSLGMASVAEGIETPDVLAKVIAAGCDEAQGYYFSRPVAVSSLPEALRMATENQHKAA